ncbi:MAG: DUF4321 domain-containing protein [Calditrichia bacterium]
MKKKSLAYYVFIIIMGGVVGSVLGNAIGIVLPVGVVKQFFLQSWPFGIEPSTLDLGILKLTFGLKINFNIIGVVGIFLLAYFLRWID